MSAIYATIALLASLTLRASLLLLLHFTSLRFGLLKGALSGREWMGSAPWRVRV